MKTPKEKKVTRGVLLDKRKRLQRRLDPNNPHGVSEETIKSIERSTKEYENVLRRLAAR